MQFIELERKRQVNKEDMKAKVHIVDCTIRDGGYLLDKNSAPESFPSEG